MADAAPASLHSVRFPGESGEYRAARDQLLEAEIALRQQTEAVAAMRRALPPGGAVREDYVFAEGADSHPVRLSELFGDKATLLLYSYMYGPAMAQACPSCSAMLDALDGQVTHITQRAAVAVAARSPIDRILDFAEVRGWRHLRLISAAGNTYAHDYHTEAETGAQRPILNVFTRGPDGVIRHQWSSELAFVPPEPGQDPRHIDMLWPLWAALDLTPEGRGADFRPSLTY